MVYQSFQKKKISGIRSKNIRSREKSAKENFNFSYIYIMPYSVLHTFRFNENVMKILYYRVIVKSGKPQDSPLSYTPISLFLFFFKGPEKTKLNNI